MNNFTIERTGTGIERTGTGIERTGTGIERTGTGIERTGTGIERTGTGIALQLAIVLCLASPVALAESVEAPQVLDSIPASVTIRDDSVSLKIGATGCEIAGTGWQELGYARFPVSLSLDADATILVSGNGTGDKVSGNGTGDKVSGNGTGDRTDAQLACADLIAAFSIEAPESLDPDATSWTGVWGAAEVAIDGKDRAAVLIRNHASALSDQGGVALEATVIYQ